MVKDADVFPDPRRVTHRCTPGCIQLPPPDRGPPCPIRPDRPGKAVGPDQRQDQPVVGLMAQVQQRRFQLARLIALRAQRDQVCLARAPCRCAPPRQRAFVKQPTQQTLWRDWHRLVILSGGPSMAWLAALTGRAGPDPARHHHAPPTMARHPARAPTP